MEKLKMLTITIFGSTLILLVLCIGSQNINNRKVLNIPFKETAPLPVGFLTGLSITLGFLSGGLVKICNYNLK